MIAVFLRTCENLEAMAAFGDKAEIALTDRNVR